MYNEKILPFIKKETEKMKKTLLVACALSLSFCLDAYADSNSLSYVKEAMDKHCIYEVQESSEDDISAFIKTVDENAEYYTTTTEKYLPYDILGFDGGMGLVFNVDEDGKAYVSNVMADSQAGKTDIQPMWKLKYINDTDVSGRKLTGSTLASHVKGISGNEVSLTFVDENGEEHTYEFVRDREPSMSIEFDRKGFEKKDKLSTGVIYVDTFNYNSPTEFQRAIQSFGENGIRNCLIDLRTCTDGLVESAIEAAGLFVKNATDMGSLKTKDGEIAFKSKNIKLDGGVAILLSEKSSTAAKVFAHILKENQRAGIIADKELENNDEVLTYFNIPKEGGMIKFTTGKYITKDKKTFSETKTVPDMLIDANIPTPSLEIKANLGDKGEECKQIKSLLSLLGYEMTDSDEYDEKAFSAVMDFQGKNKLYAYGVCDFTTQKAIRKAVFEKTMTEDNQCDKALDYISENRYR